MSANDFDFKITHTMINKFSIGFHNKNCAAATHSRHSKSADGVNFRFT